MSISIRKTAPVLAVGSLFLLAACGNTPGCRAITGAGIGAGAGAIVGALAGSPLTGAAVGAAAGGAVGGLTSPNEVKAGDAPGCE